MPEHESCPFGDGSRLFDNGVSSSPAKILCHKRSTPAVIMSDNGSQFVGAKRELREMVNAINKEEVQEFCGEKRMQ